jgi:putative phosphoribosyl transferase
MLFSDRSDAGRQLGSELLSYANRDDVLVLGLPRGGVPVAFEVARALAAPLDVFLVRKLGVPGQPELAMGAIASGGARVLNEQVVELLHIPPKAINAVAVQESRELARRERDYRGKRPMPDIRGRVVILVDDGLATGSTMRAAIAAIRRFEPVTLIVAVPVGPLEACQKMASLADKIVCLKQPEYFNAVGVWYRDFDQVTDEQVRSLLKQAAAEMDLKR